MPPTRRPPPGTLLVTGLIVACGGPPPPDGLDGVTPALVCDEQGSTTLTLTGAGAVLLDPSRLEWQAPDTVTGLDDGEGVSLTWDLDDDGAGDVLLADPFGLTHGGGALYLLYGYR